MWKKDINSDYQNAEIALLKKNLKKLSEGDFYVESFNIEFNESNTKENEDFKEINQYISKIAISMKNLTDDTGTIADFIRSGDISENKKFRLSNDKYDGKYSTIVDNINDIYSTLLTPLIELWHILGDNMCNNNFTVHMSNNYMGDFEKLAGKVDNLIDKLLYMQGCAVKIANGDTSEIETLTKIGKRSEHDELVPAFLKMNLSVKAIIDGTSRLANKAANGDLSDRGDTTKLKGGFNDIVIAINNMLDAVSRPMQEVTGAMEQMSIGNLKVKIDGDYKGEFAALVDAVNKTVVILNNVVEEIGANLTKMANADLNISSIRDYKGDFNNISTACNILIDELNNIIKEIFAAAQQVASGSGQIADTSVMLSQGSEEQASSIEEVTSAITQMAAQVQQNAANATQADSLSVTARENAIKGDEQMEKMIGAMHDINESSSNISKIIKVIDDIAFQTNILALNAAVEAARAGQYGKGFAVVAEEVRNLAQKSAAAAKETTAMIESSIEKVKLGTDIANNTESALKEIVGSVTKSTDLVGQIASASNEQASAISQVSQAIEQVSDVVQTNSATAEESASASEELTGQAEMLKSLVSKFKLRSDSAGDKFNIDNLSPELLNSIEDMIEKNNNSKKKNDEKVISHKEAQKVNAGHKIDLNGEF